MNPVNSNTNTSSGCSSIVSSNCVNFVGTLPDCISVCANPSVTDVIEAIAIVTCEALSTANYNVTTIEQITGNSVTNSNELIDGLIKSIEDLQSQIINNDTDITNLQNITTTVPDIELASCVVDKCSSCVTGTAYSIQKALQITSEVFCTELNTLDVKIESNTKIISSLSSQITNGDAQTAKNNISYTDSAINALNLNVTVNTEKLLGATSGATQPIADAVQYLRTKVGEYRSNIGTITQISTAKAAQENTLYSQKALNPTLAAGTLLSGIGVTATTSTLAESLQQNWIVLQDLRKGLIDCCENSDLPCIAIAPNSLAIPSITNTGFAVTWNLHGLTGIEAETAARIELYEAKGTQTVGSPYHTFTESDLSQLGSGNSKLKSFAWTELATQPSNNETFIIRVYSIYNGCGEAYTDIQATRPCIQELFAKYIWSGGSAVATCDGTNYNRLTASHTLKLVDASGNDVNNISGADLNINLIQAVQTPYSTAVLYEIYQFVIPNNSNSVTRTDLGYAYEKVLVSGTCQEVRRGFGVTYAANLERIKIEPPADRCDIGVQFTSSLYE